MVIDLIQLTNESTDEIVHRVPEAGSGEFRLGSQLVVREGQQAVFVRDGKALDVFGPGRHTISTNNIPFLSGLLNVFTGGRSIFTAEVFFVAMREFTNLKWGTAQPLAFRDPDFGMVRLRAFGSYSMRVANPQLFVGQFVGSRSSYSAVDAEDFLRSIILSEFNDIVGDAKTPLLDLPGLSKELADTARASLSDDFERVGLQLTTFQIGAITPPDEVQKAIDQRSSMGAIGDMGAFTQYQAAQAMREAANNPGGAGDLAGGGVGMGAGMAMGSMMSQAMRDATAPKSSAMPAPTQENVDIVGQLERLDKLRQSGALSEAEFASMKAKLLG